MVTCASIYTYEVDDREIALAELKAQLDEKVALLENSVGIILCHPEFIQTGMLKFICENLPFDLVGATTASQAVNGEAGELLLTIFIITSNDVYFKVGVSESLNGDIVGITESAYHLAAMGMQEQPKLAIIFPPLTLQHAGDVYVDAWSQIIPNTPIFGSHAIDDTLSFESSETIYNGANYKLSMSFVLCYGNINPRFLIGTLPENSVTPYTGEITKAEGPLVHEINHTNTFQYLKDLGFTSDNASTDNFLFLPFRINFINRPDYDGIPVMRALASFTEDGSAIFRGNVYENSRFVFSKCVPGDVLATALEKVEEVNAMPDVNGVLLLPCIVRRMVLSLTPLKELECIRDNLKAPFMMGYAGGEICPTSATADIAINRFHNYSLVILVI